MYLLEKFSKRDVVFAIVTGFITGFIAWRIFEFLNVPTLGLPWVSLVVIIPIFWLLGVMLGYFLGQWFDFFNQFGKFVAIGFTNSAVDFGVLNLLIASTGTTSGWGYVVIKAASFVSAMVPSYFWNRFWAFYKKGATGSRLQFIKFATVAVASIFVNTGVASIIVNLFDPMFGTNAEQWANLAAVAGSASALIFSFLGFKLAVFRK